MLYSSFLWHATLGLWRSLLYRVFYLSELCRFTIPAKHGPDIHLQTHNGWLCAIYLCSAYLHYILWLSYFLSDLSSSYGLEIKTILKTSSLTTCSVHAIPITLLQNYITNCKIEYLETNLTAAEKITEMYILPPWLASLKKNY